ncbi:MAG: hypothetical protein QHJ82_02230 [Verrucomicrobiota bacterium]|nr:hypothetical protein [Verrucomicrobiota bacterium]
MRRGYDEREADGKEGRRRYLAEFSEKSRPGPTAFSNRLISGIFVPGLTPYARFHEKQGAR